MLAHLNGGGMGMKHEDLFGAFCCSDCHAYIDGGWTRSDATLTEVLRYHHEGMVRTQKIWLREGLVKI